MYLIKKIYETLGEMKIIIEVKSAEYRIKVYFCYELNKSFILFFFKMANIFSF
jgi:mRNA-degrading endonuclease HigB of HigAB toxin-antitoxin module